MVAEPEYERAQPKPAPDAPRPMPALIHPPGRPAPESSGTGRLGLVSAALLAAGVATTVVFKNEIREAPLFAPPGETQSAATNLANVKLNPAGPAPRELKLAESAGPATASPQVQGKTADYIVPSPVSGPKSFRLALLPAALGTLAAGYKSAPAAHGKFLPRQNTQTVRMIGFDNGQYVYEVANNSGRRWTGHLTDQSSGETWDVRIPAGGTVRIQTSTLFDDFHPLVGYTAKQKGR